MSPMDKTISAYDRLFGTVELFDLIFELCDAFTILCSLSVSTHWRTHILNSKPLRHHLSTLQPPALIPNTPSTTGIPSGSHRLSSPSTPNDHLKPWCLRHPSLHGTLWILRIPLSNLETFLLIPHSHHRPLQHLNPSTTTKTLTSARSAWKRVYFTTDPQERYTYGPPLPDLEWRSLNTGRVLCRTRTKQLPWWYNTLREYLVVFYGDEFEGLTGERLRRGRRDWRDGRCARWPKAACENCQGRFWGDGCPLREVICRHDHVQMCEKCTLERYEGGDDMAKRTSEHAGLSAWKWRWRDIVTAPNVR